MESNLQNKLSLKHFDDDYDNLSDFEKDEIDYLISKQYK